MLYEQLLNNPFRFPVMSVLRMIKLFGWEARIKKLVAETRQEELKWVWKRKLLVMLSRIVKYVEDSCILCFA